MDKQLRKTMETKNKHGWNKWKNRPPIIINNQPQPYSSIGKILGLQVSSTGYKSHLNERVRKSKMALQLLKRIKTL